MNDSEYKVNHLIDNTYQVVKVGWIEGQSWDGWDDYYGEEVMYQGTISDCEAYIRLTVGGFLK